MNSLSLVIPLVHAAAWVTERVASPRPFYPPGSPDPHADPRANSPVPVTGAPYYLAGLTIGGPLSDLGSHAGLKAAVTTNARASGRALLEISHATAFNTCASRIDRSRLVVDGAPLERVSIDFRPWGWLETARDVSGARAEARAGRRPDGLPPERAEAGGVHAEAEVATLATDAFLTVATLRNAGAAPLRLRPRLEVVDDPDFADEAQQPLRLSRGGRWTARVDERGAARIGFRRRTGPAPLDFDATRFFRAISSSLGPLRLLRLERAHRRGFLASLAGAPLELAPGASATLHFVFGYGESEDEAATSLARGEARLVEAGGPRAALDAIAREWRSYLGGVEGAGRLPAEERAVLDLAATGLRMSAVEPRGRMPARATLPAKLHFNMIVVWDTAFQALGLAETDLPLAKDSLTTLLASQQRDGSLCYGVGPELKPFVPSLAATSQPPAVALAVRTVFERDGARDRAWLEPLHERLRRNLAWWERARDLDGDGLFSWLCAFESGWDDSPRIPNPRVPKLRALTLDVANLSGLASSAHIASVDVNAWMYTMYTSLAATARHLGRASEAAGYEAKAALLASRVEATLWDEETGAWLDREIEPGGRPGRFMRVLTPSMAWPLFAGLSRDARRAARVIEGHLLDPARFFGDPDDPRGPRFPVPSVAFGDPAYAREEDGYYWRGQVWGPACWATIVALHRYGYAAEAETLRARLIRLWRHASAGGLFETYDPLTGRVGYGSGSLTGAGEPACFQIGLTTAVAAMVTLRAYERQPVVLERGSAPSLERAAAPVAGAR